MDNINYNAFGDQDENYYIVKELIDKGCTMEKRQVRIVDEIHKFPYTYFTFKCPNDVCKEYLQTSNFTKDSQLDHHQYLRSKQADALDKFYSLKNKSIFQKIFSIFD